MNLFNRLTLLALIIFAASACSSQNDANQTSSGLSKDKIVYEYTGTNSGGNTVRELCMVTADNSISSQISFTNDGAPKTFIGISNDGYIAYMNGRDNSILSVPVSNISAATTKAIVTETEYSIDPIKLTQDNRIIYYLGWQLYSVKVDGSEPKVAINGSNNSFYYGTTTNNRIIFSDDNGIYATDTLANNKIILSNERPRPDVRISGTKIVWTDSQGIYTADVGLLNVSTIKISSDGQIDLSYTDGNKIIYSKRDQAWTKLFVMNIDGSNNIQLTSLQTGDDTFHSVFNNIVVFNRNDGITNAIFSTPVTGGSEVTIMNNPTFGSQIVGATMNSLVIEQNDLPLYRSIFTINPDGSSLKTIATGTSGEFAGGLVKLVTPDGMIVYEKGANTTLMTSAKYDNSTRGSFINTQGKMGYTSTNRIISTKEYNGALRFYTVLSDGSEPFLLKSAFNDGINEIKAIIQ